MFYPGTKILKQGSNGDRKEMAQKLVADLETILGPRNRKLPFARKQRLPKDAALRIERGMHSGAQKIQNHLKQKYRGRTVSAGLKKRLTELGWSV